MKNVAKAILIMSLLLISFLSSAQSKQTIYTWVDSKGIRHFNDHPQHIDAQPITLENKPLPLTPTPDEELQKKTPLHKNRDTAEATEATNIEILSPRQNETLRNNQGEIVITTELSRKLKPDEQLQLILGGTSYGAPQTTQRWILKNIDRGKHQISIQVVSLGKVIASSITITVHLKRASAIKVSK
ncbi:DUF4124 domain-containing protein [Vibrio sinensis]|uniref:DUF4124 domain-containing protein n=1 Tax=Vibrio sinensis TaxID=2302434 RepID=A0A3A6QPD3_9VIBR|nr:DUF4124 domain-containing protein [Vibrio sinensis]RJX72456.1 DUF4124 domain-containing protein [Vibrio sinensis]